VGTVKLIGAEDFQPLVRLKVRNARGVQVPSRENAFRPVTDRNCDIVRCGGEQREVKS